MCLFTQAAKAWSDLIGTQYEIIAGRKGKQYTICLDFEAADFPHVAGMHYARDVDFGRRFSEYRGEKLIHALVSGKIDGTKIEKSRNWPRIEGRLKAIINLKSTLESNFKIALFDPQRVRGMNSQIDADYLIQDSNSDEIYFVFIDDEKQQRHYCKSAFKKEQIDYMDNQQKLTTLNITKRTNGITTTLYIHPNFTCAEVDEPATV